MSEFITKNAPIIMSYSPYNKPSQGDDLGIFNDYNIFMKQLNQVVSYFEKKEGVVIGGYSFIFYSDDGIDDLEHFELSKNPSGRSIYETLSEAINKASKDNKLSTLHFTVFLTDPDKLEKLFDRNSELDKKSYDPLLPEGKIYPDYSIVCIVETMNRLIVEQLP
jgi:hypothetical protein